MKRRARGKKPASEVFDWREFVHKVVFTTCLSFTLISFLYFIINASFIEFDDKETYFQFAGYTLGKIFCLFLFSFAMGFINRIPEKKKGRRAVLRLIHFGASLGAFALFIVYLFNTILLESGENSGLTPKWVVWYFTWFVLFYFVILGGCILARGIFGLKQKDSYKSILD